MVITYVIEIQIISVELPARAARCEIHLLIFDVFLPRAHTKTDIVHFPGFSSNTTYYYVVQDGESQEVKEAKKRVDSLFVFKEKSERIQTF